MKKYTLFLILLMLLSCCKDEDKITIIGTWKLSAMVTDFPVDGYVNGVYTKDIYKNINNSIDTEQFEITLDFLENRKFYYYLKQSLPSDDSTFFSSANGSDTIIGLWEINDLNTKLYLEPIKDSDYYIFKEVEDISLSKNKLIFIYVSIMLDGTAFDMEFRRI